MRQVRRQTPTRHRSQRLPGNHHRLMVDHRAQLHPPVTSQNSQPGRSHIAGRMIQPELKLKLSVIPLALEVLELAASLAQLMVTHMRLNLQMESLMLPKSPLTHFMTQLVQRRIHATRLHINIRINHILPAVSKLALHASSQATQRAHVIQVLVNTPLDPARVFLREKTVQHAAHALLPLVVRPQLKLYRPQLTERPAHLLTTTPIPRAKRRIRMPTPIRILIRMRATKPQLLRRVTLHRIQRRRPMPPNRIHVTVVHLRQCARLTLHSVIKTISHRANLRKLALIKMNAHLDILHRRLRSLRHHPHALTQRVFV